MDVEVSIEKNLLKPKVVIHTAEMTQEITDLVKRLTDYSEHILVVYKNDEIILLSLEDIYRIYALGQKVLAQSPKDTVQLKQRLFELEERLTGTQMIRISNSEIVNLKKVKTLDMSNSGTITMKFDNGEKSFVSRRYVEKIKKYIGL